MFNTENELDYTCKILESLWDLEACSTECLEFRARVPGLLGCSLQGLGICLARLIIFGVVVDDVSFVWTGRGIHTSTWNWCNWTQVPHKVGDTAEFFVDNFYRNARAVVMWGSALGIERKVRTFLLHPQAADITNTVFHAVSRFPSADDVPNTVASVVKFQILPKTVIS